MSSQENLILSFFRGAQDGFALTDVQGQIIEWNQAMEALTGYSKEDVLGKHIWDVHWLMVVEEMRAKEGPNAILQYYLEFLKGRVERSGTPIEARARRKDGRRLWLEYRSFSVPADDGFMIGLVARDTTARKEGENNLALEMQIYKTFFEVSGAAALVIENDTTISLVNEGFCKVTGFSKEEVEWHMSWRELVHPSDIERLAKYHNQRRIDPSSAPREYEFRMMDRGGKMHNAVAFLDTIPGSTRTVASFIDITEIREAYETLTRLERRTRETLDSISDAFFSLDENLTITYFNGAAERILGKKKKDVLGVSLFKAFPEAKGSVFEERYLRAIMEKQPDHFETYFDVGPLANWYDVRVYPQDRGISVFFQVTTEQKLMAIALKEANSKLNLLNSLTRHDLNNQLIVLRGNMILAEKVTKNDKVRTHLEKGLRASDNISRLLEFSRDYQGLGKDKPEWLNLQEVSTLGMVSVDTGRIVIEMELDNYEVFADKMLEKVFHNLASNSVNHGKKVERIRLTAEPRNSHLVIIYEDDGVGLDPEIKKAVFSPDRGYHGLYLVRGVLEMTGMTIAEVGEKGKGARFEITLPKGTYRTLAST